VSGLESRCLRILFPLIVQTSQDSMRVTSYSDWYLKGKASVYELLIPETVTCMNAE